MARRRAMNVLKTFSKICLQAAPNVVTNGKFDVLVTTISGLQREYFQSWKQNKTNLKKNKKTYKENLCD